MKLLLIPLILLLTNCAKGPIQNDVKDSAERIERCEKLGGIARINYTLMPSAYAGCDFPLGVQKEKGAN